MEGKHALVSFHAGHQNPLAQLQDRLKEVDAGFKSWLAKQSAPVEAAVVSVTNAAQGAVMGGFMATLTKDMSTALPVPSQQGAAGLGPDAMGAFTQAQALSGSPLVQARNFAVMTGVNAGISCAMKRARGVDDVWNCIAAGFGSGAMFSLVSGVGGPNPVLGAVSSGVGFAVFQGGFYKIGEKFSPKPVDDVNYMQTKNMLNGLGLGNYVNNFKKGMLTDQTLPLLTDSALKDVSIPPGPRLIILAHLQRDLELVKGPL